SPQRLISGHCNIPFTLLIARHLPAQFTYTVEATIRAGALPSARKAHRSSRREAPLHGRGRRPREELRGAHEKRFLPAALGESACGAQAGLRRGDLDQPLVATAWITRSCSKKTEKPA